MNHEVKFYGFTGSHPCEAVYTAASYKGIEHQKVEVPPGLHRIIMSVMFGGARVPAAKIDGRKVQGTSEIFLVLDELNPDRPLFPADADDREQVVAAESWGEGEFQDIGRRLVWSHLSRSPETVRTWIASSNPPGLVRTVKILLAPSMSHVAKFGNGATDAQVQKDLNKLPELLDRVDQLIADGVIGGDEPNAADFQLLSSIAMWMNMRDIRPAIKDRPCGIAAAQLFPQYKGVVPAGLLPEGWFANLNASRENDLTSPA
jgi:glutathione S-transferase